MLSFSYFYPELFPPFSDILHPKNSVQIIVPPLKAQIIMEFVRSRRSIIPGQLKVVQFDSY